MLCLGSPLREARPGTVSGEMDRDSSAQAEDEHPHMQLLQNNHSTLTLEKSQFINCVGLAIFNLIRFIYLFSYV